MHATYKSDIHATPLLKFLATGLSLLRGKTDRLHALIFATYKELV